MSDRYDVMAAKKYVTRDREEKTVWIRVGTMFASRNGPGFSIQLDAMPLHLDEKGGVRMQAFEPRERNGGGDGGRRGPFG